jgi:transposase
MNTDPTPPSFARYIAIDLHKRYVMVGGIDAQQRVVLQPRKVDLHRWTAWAEAQFTASDAVVLEATTNAWAIYAQLLPLVGKIVVADAFKIRQIAASRIKTDQQDVLILAQLLRAELVPSVWVPPAHVREVRAVIAHRTRLVRMSTMAKNRLQSLLHRHNLRPPAGKLFAPKHRTWWRQLELPFSERLRIEQDLATLDHLAPQVATIDRERHRLSTSAPWAEQVPYLLQLPGIGVVTAMTVLAAIGEITRFPHAKQLVGYAGLGASVHASGDTYRTGRITKEGRRELRWVLVEAAHTAARSHPYWKQELQRLERRIGTGKAIVAIARKLLVAMWHVLTKQIADRRADADQVAFKLMTWAWKLTPGQRLGMTSRQFIRYHLLRLRLGDELSHIRRGGTPRPLAPPEEILALRPELTSSR